MAATKQYTLTGRISLVIASLLVAGLLLSGALKRFDYSLQDQVASLRERTVPSNLVIIEIDSYSLAQIPQWPWDRQLYADVLDQLRLAEVNSVFIDVDFSSVSNPTADAALAQSINRLAETAKVRLPTFVQLSNIALHTAKSKGLEYDDCESTQVSVEPQRLNIIGAIRNSLQNDDFDLAFQPKVDMYDDKMVGCEVLLRPPVNWTQDVPVYKIIEVAESTLGERCFSQ